MLFAVFWGLSYTLLDFLWHSSKVVTNFIVFFICGNWGSEELASCLKPRKGDHTGIWSWECCFGPGSHYRCESLWNEQTAAVLFPSDGSWGIACAAFMEGQPCAQPCAHHLEEESTKWSAAFGVSALLKWKQGIETAPKREQIIQEGGEVLLGRWLLS